MPRSPEMTGFIATIKRPDATEARGIVLTQVEISHRAIICTFNQGAPNEHTRTVIPNLHFKNDMQKELADLANSVSQADLVQILDLSER